MMLRALIVTSCLASVLAVPVKTSISTSFNTQTELEAHFESFIQKYSKQYESIEHKLHRFAVFVENFNFINSWNTHNVSTGVTVGINEFADLTHDEFKSFYLGYKPTPKVQARIEEAAKVEAANPTDTACSCKFYIGTHSGQAKYCEEFSVGLCLPDVLGCSIIPYAKQCAAGPAPPTPPTPPTPPGPAPSGDSVDWVAKGAVTPVKNQAHCGSCWAFSTTGGLEGAIFAKHGVLESLSEEELVQCDKVDHGCQGGAMENAFTFIQKSGGIALESTYPYTSATGAGSTGSCVTSKKTPVAKYTSEVSGYTDVPHSNEAALKAAVKMHPVSVAIEADKQVFQFYKTGVLKKSAGCGTKLDHGVLAVGYGVEDGTMYWKVKNSWGPSWGDQGYVKLERTDSTSSSGTCGIALDASYPKL